MRKQHLFPTYPTLAITTWPTCIKELLQADVTLNYAAESRQSVLDVWENHETCIVAAAVSVFSRPDCIRHNPVLPVQELVRLSLSNCTGAHPQ